MDDVKLKKCGGCDLVRYCSDTCKEDHRPEHEAKCKERAAELYDDILFRQPESSYLGDCPICCVPLEIKDGKRSMYPCCGKLICNGCAYANQMLKFQENMPRTCPFCRQPVPKTDEEGEMIMMKRVAANDPVALCLMGERQSHERDFEGAFEYWTKAAELGGADAHFKLALLYFEGLGVQKDEKKELFHLEEAAILGHPHARHNLGCIEESNGRFDRAVKHWIIAANLGLDRSIQELKECFKKEFVSKEDFAVALRAHHAAIDATKSPQRREAAEFLGV